MTHRISDGTRLNELNHASDSDSLVSSQLARTRLLELENKVQGWLEEANNDPEVHRQGGLFCSPERLKLVLGKTCRFQGVASSSVIAIDPLFLIKPEDVPEYLKLQITRDPLGRDDPRFITQAYSAEVFRWIEGFLGMQGLNVDGGALQSFMAFLSKPELFEKAKEFILAHELGHIVYRDCMDYERNQKQFSLNFCSSIFAAAAGSGIFAFANLGSFSFLQAGVSALGMGYLAYKTSRFAATALYDRFCEKRADLFAKQFATGEGGVFYFKTLREFMYHHRQSPVPALGERIMRKLTIDSKGNPLFELFDHPSFSEREGYLA